MITPADLARMLSRAADDADDHTQMPSHGPEEPSKLMYSTATPNAGLSASIGSIVLGEDETEEAPDSDAVTMAMRSSNAPTPRMMPQRRSQDTPATFASLDAQELPVVREYSAGGLIFDERGRVAIIARHSRSGHLEWCLPKGHIEKGETPEQTAVREVHEETGILGEVIESIATIDYWFTGTSQRVHKLVHHYALKRIGGELTVEGDPDHEAEDAIWVDFRDLDDVLSYPNERKIAWLYARKTKKQA
ncbi:NUDIX hydrolase [Bifidobacterium avesanii]|uniref:NUDIX domain-containing protein n=1 Tax=Bifidobacterium avesanii TaxID=1798157 RepID=A0A7K3TJ15_9BIFI|nr:NUDIX hydrolase [Bifidobacterium avesanii]KAB8291993.1 phosphohydrolase [Bifidobacterium avesanii]NEG78644.1 NUDIX domain-containing protein [Bifidobacterium avesanii]